MKILSIIAILLALAGSLAAAESPVWTRTTSIVLVRARPAEVAELLKARCGAVLALSAAAGVQGSVDLGPREMDVRSIITETARQAGLTLVFRGDEALAWTVADPVRLADLRRRARQADAGRCTAILALGRCGDRSVIPDLCAALGEADADVCASAVRALLGFTEVLRFDPPPDLVGRLLAAQGRMPAWLKPEVLRLIDACATPAAEAALLAGGTFQPQWSAGRAAFAQAASRPAAWEALARITPGRLRPFLDLLPRQAPSMTDLRSLRRLRLAAGDEALLRQILALSRNASADLRLAATGDLALSTDPVPHIALLGLLADPDRRVREQAAFSLANLGDTAPAVPVLLGMLPGGRSKGDWRRRYAIFTAFSRQPGLGHDARLLPAIAAWITPDPSDNVSAGDAAVSALAALRSPASLAVIRGRLADPRERHTTLRHAALTREAALIDLCLPLLRDDAPYIASAAAECLAQLPLDAAAWAALRATMAGATSDAKSTMASCIAADLRPDHPLEDLLDAWCRDSDPAVRRFAGIAWQRRHGRPPPP